MPVAGASAHDLAILFDDVREGFDVAARELDRLCGALPPSRARTLDLIYLPPASLFCRLRLKGDAGGAGRLTIAQTPTYRVLNLLALSEIERERFVSSRLLRSTWSALNVEDTAPVMEELRGQLTARSGSHADRHPRDRNELALPVRVELAGQSLVGLARDVTTVGMYVECEAQPSPGDDTVVSFETTIGRAPINLPARVAFVMDEEGAAAYDRNPGFGVELLLDLERQSVVESFVAAAARGKPWPERSGRLHARFDLGLRAMFVLDEATRDVRTRNVSRGGVFLEAVSPPPVGSELLLILYHPGSAGRARIRGRVVRHAKDDAAGAGVRFLEPGAVVEQKLRSILDAMEVQVRRSALLVDADSFYRAALGNVLRAAGFEILEARDADEGFGHVLDRLSRIDLVVIDLFAGGMGLRGLIERILNLSGAARPVLLAVTDRLEDANTEALERLGVDAVLLKSTSANDLLERVTELSAHPRSVPT